MIKFSIENAVKNNSSIDDIFHLFIENRKYEVAALTIINKG